VLRQTSIAWRTVTREVGKFLSVRPEIPDIDSIFQVEVALVIQPPLTCRIGNVSQGSDRGAFPT